MNELKLLQSEGIISPEQMERITEHERNKPMSVRWELITVLSAGIALFTTGIGMLIYINIESIGHISILGLILCACCACFYHAFRHRKPYTSLPVEYESPFFSYIILTGCILAGIFTGYIQYQYSLFGEHYGIATLLPTILFFASAYLFDHRGILSLAISGLACWAGLTVTPASVLTGNDFSDPPVITTAIVLGIVLGVFARISFYADIKKHFASIYNNFALNLTCIAALASLFLFSMKTLSFMGLAAVCFYFIRCAKREQSFLFLLLSTIYGYIGLTYSFFSVLAFIFRDSASAEIIIMAFFYIISSCAGIVYFFISYKKNAGAGR